MHLQPSRAAAFAEASAGARPAKWECYVDVFGPRGWGLAALMD
jgi:hypothetical protein